MEADKSNKTILPLVKVFFDDPIIPEFIRIFGTKRKVFSNIPPVRRCNKCMHYGHMKEDCKGKPRCGQCAGNHLTNECDTDDILCCHCNGNHYASFKKCPQFLFYQKINQVRVVNKVNFQEAKKIIIDEQKISQNNHLDDVTNLPSPMETNEFNNFQVFSSQSSQLKRSTPIKEINIVKIRPIKSLNNNSDFSENQINVIKNLIDASVKNAINGVVEKTTNDFLKFLANKFDDSPEKENILLKIQTSGKEFLESFKNSEKHQ